MRKKHQLAFQLMRPYQWVKNSFCLAGVAFGQYYTFSYIFQALIVFIAFCFASSCVYIINDIIDIESDKHHPEKKYRPLASGELDLVFAQYLAVGCFLLASFLSIFISLFAFSFVLSYILLNIAYSTCLKNIVVLDVFAISLGFLFRLFAGTIGLNIVSSEWLIVCTLMITLLLGFAKRRSELLLYENTSHHPNTRSVLKDYTAPMLDVFIASTTAGSLISYSLFILLSSKPQLIYTIFLVLYGIFRYIFKLYRYGKGQDTANDMLDDPHLILTAVIWVSLYLYIC